jgi:hypothetical protein
MADFFIAIFNIIAGIPKFIVQWPSILYDQLAWHSVNRRFSSSAEIMFSALQIIWFVFLIVVIIFSIVRLIE